MERSQSRALRCLPFALVVAVIVFAAGCDTNEPETCKLLDEDTYSASAPLVERLSAETIAHFELQQNVRRFETRSCDLPVDGISEITLVIRNAKSCEISFGYRLSVFEGRVGATIEGSALIRQGAATDEGTIMRDSGIRLDRSQIIVTASNVMMDSCV